jgi:hypothetical protein
LLLEEQVCGASVVFNVTSLPVWYAMFSAAGSAVLNADCCFSGLPGLPFSSFSSDFMKMIESSFSKEL